VQQAGCCQLRLDEALHLGVGGDGEPVRGEGGREVRREASKSEAMRAGSRGGYRRRLYVLVWLEGECGG
jgi:hypothetical protein